MSVDLAQMEPGFSDASFGSQSVFRGALEALSRPGTVVEIDADAHVPQGVHPAANAVLLALLDQDTALFLPADPLFAAAGSFLRFHTGCRLVNEPGEADFALLRFYGSEMSVERFPVGSESYPDRSATLVIQTAALAEGTGWTLSGPGISGRRRLAVGGFGEAFIEQWNANRRIFPCGVDVFLVCGSKVVGLPRTTRIEV